MPAEPITTTPPRPVRLATMGQDWRDVVFMHWEVAPDEAARFLPRGIEPDLFEGRTFVGLVGPWRGPMSRAVILARKSDEA